MADLEKFLEFQYKVIELIDEEKKVYLVQDAISGRIYQKRKVSHMEGKICNILKEISHPNLVKVEGVYQLEDSSIVVEEYINGCTMRELLEQKRIFTEEVAEQYIRQLCGALGEIHKKNLVHRNINPDSIMITTNGVVKLTNFGAVRRIDGKKNKDTVLMGTAGYAAPEQFGFGESDSRTDIYALGVLLNVMLTGHMPVDGLYSGKRTLRTIIKQCIPIDKSKRYKSVDEMIQELERSKSGYYAQKFYGQFPGLRSDRWYCKLLAFIGYVVFFFALFGIPSFMIDEYGVTEHTYVYIAVVMLFEWILPWAAVGNVGEYDVKLLRLYAVPKPLRIMICLVIGYLLHIFGVILDNALSGEFELFL